MAWCSLGAFHLKSKITGDQNGLETSGKIEAQRTLTGPVLPKRRPLDLFLCRFDAPVESCFVLITGWYLNPCGIS